MHEGFYWDGEKKKGTRVCVGERERERDELDKNRYRNITIYNLNKKIGRASCRERV